MGLDFLTNSNEDKDPKITEGKIQGKGTNSLEPTTPNPCFNSWNMGISLSLYEFMAAYGYTMFKVVYS